MNSAPRRWLVPLLAGLAVLLVVAVMWSQRPGASGGDVGFAGGGSDGSRGQGSPPYDGTGSGGPVGVLPVDPPADAGADGSGSAGGDVDLGTIAVTTYYPYDATHLALNYTNGIPECYGDAGTPLVQESPDAVVVTIPRVPVKNSGNRACIDIAQLSSVDITLDAPLAGRPVLDGARDGAGVPAAAAPNDPDQAR